MPTPRRLQDPEQAQCGRVGIRGRFEEIDEPRIGGQRLADELIDLIEEAGR